MSGKVPSLPGSREWTGDDKRLWRGCKTCPAVGNPRRSGKPAAGRMGWPRGIESGANPVKEYIPRGWGRPRPGEGVRPAPAVR